MVEWIAKELGVTTLRYQKIEDMVEAIGLPRENSVSTAGSVTTRFEFGFRNADFGI